MSIRRPQIVGHPSKEHCIKMCDYERDYVHELQRILFSYFKNDISIIAEKLKTIEDKNGKIFKQFEEEIKSENMGGRLDFFHWREIMGIDGVKLAMDTVMSFHKKLEDIKEKINQQIENPEDQLQLVSPFFMGIHKRGSPRSKTYERRDIFEELDDLEE